MKAHADVEQLSGYLDRAIDEEERRRIERHLAACPACRSRLEGLERVVRQVEALGRTSPPVGFERQLRWRLRAEQRHRSWFERLEGGLRENPVPPSLFVGFAVVLALAAILYLFSSGVAWRAESPGTRIVMPGGAAVEEEGVVEAAGRRFRREGGGWRQVGIAGPPTTVVDPDGPAGRRLLAAHPELGDLARLGGAVVVQVDGGVLEIGFPGAPDGAGVSERPDTLGRASPEDP